MDISTTTQSEDQSLPLADNHDEIMDSMAADWLDRIFKMLLPSDLYELGDPEATRQWLLDNEIAIAQHEDVIAVMREGLVYAVWNPDVLPAQIPRKPKCKTVTK